MKIIVNDNILNYETVNITSYSKITNFEFSYSDRYNQNKHYVVKRDKNRHYYFQEFIYFKPVSKVTRVYKNFIESVLDIKITIQK